MIDTLQKPSSLLPIRFKLHLNPLASARVALCSLCFSRCRAVLTSPHCSTSLRHILSTYTINKMENNVVAGSQEDNSREYIDGMDERHWRCEWMSTIVDGWCYHHHPSHSISIVTLERGDRRGSDNRFNYTARYFQKKKSTISHMGFLQKGCPNEVRGTRLALTVGNQLDVLEWAYHDFTLRWVSTWYIAI